MMNAAVIGLMLAVGLCAPELTQGSDEQAVQSAVEGFLFHLGDHQFDAVAAVRTRAFGKLRFDERDGRIAALRAKRIVA